MRKPLLLCLASITLALASAHAQTVTYDLTGKYATDSSTPSTVFTDSGATFDLRFTVTESPKIDSPNYDDTSFTLAPQSVSFSLNGGAFTSLTPTDFTFYSLANNGSFSADVTLGDTTLSLDLGGASLFKGTEAAPTFKSGKIGINADFSSLSVSTGSFGDTSDLVTTNLKLVGAVTQPAPTPEPSTVAVVAALGTAALGVASLRARRQQVA